MLKFYAVVTDGAGESCYFVRKSTAKAFAKAEGCKEMRSVMLDKDSVLRLLNQQGGYEMDTVDLSHELNP